MEYQVQLQQACAQASKLSIRISVVMTPAGRKGKTFLACNQLVMSWGVIVPMQVVSRTAAVAEFV